MTTTHDTAFGETALRDRAVERLHKRRDFKAHLLVYFLVNGFLVAIWVMAGADGFFWPVFFIGFWGIGVVMNGWDAYRREDFTESEIRHEMERLTHH